MNTILSFRTIFPNVFEEVMCALMKENPNLRESIAHQEAEIITRALVYENLVTFEKYHGNKNKVVIYLFVHLYNKTWEEVYRKYGRRTSLVQFLQKVFYEYNRTAIQLGFLGRDSSSPQFSRDNAAASQRNSNPSTKPRKT